MTFQSEGAGQGAHMAAFEQRLMERSVPYRALVELTHKCNFRCVHCYESNHNRRDELSTEQWKLAFDRLRAAGSLYLTFSGGEFLLRDDHAELSRYAKQGGFIQRFFTNAALVTDEVVAFWRDEIRPAEVEVSLYGATTRGFEATTGVRKGLSQAMAGLERLAASGLKTDVKIIALSTNVDEVGAMVEMVERFGVFTYRVSSKLSVRDDGSREPLRHKVPAERWSDYYSRFETYKFYASIDGESVPCGAGRTGIVVGPNGDVYPCVEMRRKVGNIVEQEVHEFWGGGALLDEIRAVRNKDFVFPDGVDYERVRTPCMAHNLHATGKLTVVAEPRVTFDAGQ